MQLAAQLAPSRPDSPGRDTDAVTPSLCNSGQVLWGKQCHWVGTAVLRYCEKDEMNWYAKVLGTGPDLR